MEEKVCKSHSLSCTEECKGRKNNYFLNDYLSHCPAIDLYGFPWVNYCAPGSEDLVPLFKKPVRLLSQITMLFH